MMVSKMSKIKNVNNLPVFVTFGWCRSSYAVVWSLGRRGIDVHVGDASALAMSRFSRYCKSFTKLPNFFIEPERYFERVCEALKRTGAKVLLPGHEDVGIFCRHRDDLPSEVRIALPEWDCYRIAEDKFAVLDVAQQAGCPVPHTTKVASLAELKDMTRTTTYPIVIKARTGNSAKGVRIVHDKDEQADMFKELVQTFGLFHERWPIVQEFLPGEAAGVCVLYDHGRCVVSFAERYLRCKEQGKFGTSTLRETYDNHQLISNAISIMDKLEWHGVAHLDFVADKNGEFRLIEINPRPWGALALAMFSGVDFPYFWYIAAINEYKLDLSKLQKKKIKCRWVLGEGIALVDLLKKRMFIDAFKIFWPQWRCYYDDFSLKDPLPLLFEALDYFVRFIKWRGSSNPVIDGMIR